VAIVKTENLKKDYHLGKTVIHALKGIEFEINEGDFLSVVGPSGCGKTTLMNMIGCIDHPTSGRVFFKGEDVATLSDNKEAEIRLDDIGFIFQSFNLIPVLNIFENIEFPMILKKVSKKERKERASRLIDLVGLDEYVKHKPDELSGGQRQRVAIARALVNYPKLVIADEPTANLDSETSAQVLEVMQKLNETEQVTFVFSTHDPVVMSYAKRKIILKDGKIERIEENGGVKV